MSTFYATLDATKARNLVHELVRGGVRPDDLSLVSHGKVVDIEADREMVEADSTVGDATVYVGRKDDPARDFPLRENADLTELTTIEMSDVSPVDTSNSDTDVDSVDQMEDSQEAAERMMYPKGGISQSTHERDDVSLAVLTGFPTPVPTIDDVKPGDLELEDQLDDSLETLVIPGFGTVMGGGSLATAAFDFAKGDGSAKQAMIDHLTDEGVPEDQAEALRSEFDQGLAVLAVTITPGEIDEDRVEEIAERHGANNRGLYDAPRFYNDGGQRHEHGGGQS